MQELIERTTDEGVGGSDLMKALEDINYDIAPSEKMCEGEDGEEAPAFEENEQTRIIEHEVETYDTPEKMEKMLEQEGLAIDDPVRMYLKEIGKYRSLRPSVKIPRRADRTRQQGGKGRARRGKSSPGCFNRKTPRR